MGNQRAVGTLSKIMIQDKIILASGSPRRRELIAQISSNFEVLKVTADEPRWSPPQKPLSYLDTCLSFKMSEALKHVVDGPIRSDAGKSFLVVADTIVALGRKVLGKPQDRHEAGRMLMELSNRTHTVFTGVKVAELSFGKQLSFISKSEVTFKKLSRLEVQKYISSGSPMDKAGAYGFQDEALRFVSRVKGSYLNIVGFPVIEFEKFLKENFL